MGSSMKHFGENERNSRHSRRDFIGKGLKLSIVSGIAGVGLLTGCEGEKGGRRGSKSVRRSHARA